MANGITLRQLAAKLNAIDMDKYGDIPVLDSDDMPVTDAGIYTEPDTMLDFFSFTTR